MHKLLVLLMILISVSACVTKVENHYVIEGDNNQIKAADTVSAMPNNRDMVDLTGSGYGSATAAQK